MAEFEAQAANACFALPLVQRVLASNTTIAASQGGPTVTSMAAACESIGSTAAGTAALDFLHNGYSLGQYLYGLLTASTMTGASFTVHEVMAFYAAASTVSGKDEAVRNFKYLDANGNPGNVIMLARNLAGSSRSTHPTTWWLTGNQVVKGQRYTIELFYGSNTRDYPVLNAYRAMSGGLFAALYGLSPAQVRTIFPDVVARNLNLV